MHSPLRQQVEGSQTSKIINGDLVDVKKSIKQTQKPRPRLSRVTSTILQTKISGVSSQGLIATDAFKTEWPTCRDYADALADFLAAVKLDRVNLVGTRNLLEALDRCLTLALTDRGSPDFSYLFPNFKARLAESGLPWPPKRIAFPTSDARAKR